MRIEFEFGVSVTLTLIYLHLTHLPSPTLAAVQVELLNNNNNVNLVVSSNSNSKETQVRFRCFAKYPTEWMLDVDFANGWTRNSVNNRDGWNRIQSDGTFEEYLTLKFGSFIEPMKLPCRAIGNHSDNVLVTLDPPSTDPGSIQISYESNSWEWPWPELEDKECNVKFVAAQVGSAYYWRCSTPEKGTGRLEIESCSSTSYCASKLRRIKLPPRCVTIVTNMTLAELLADKESGWTSSPMSGPGNVVRGRIAHCSYTGRPYKHITGPYIPDLADLKVPGAVEFFLTRRRQLEDIKNLHLTLDEVPRSNLIWWEPLLDPPPRTYYTRDESITTRCNVPFYGLSATTWIDAYLNGSFVQKIDSFQSTYGGRNVNYKDVNINFEIFGPGTYDIICLSYAWPTLDVVNNSFSVNVRNVVPPYFETPAVNVTFEEGAIDQELICDPGGDPTPSVAWDPSAAAYGAFADGKSLKFVKILEVWANSEFSIPCTASNSFGDTATKTFTVQVKPIAKDPRSGSNPKSSPTPPPPPGFNWSTVAIALSLVVLFIAGFVFLYFKFLKFGRAVIDALSDDEVKEFREGRRNSSKPETGSVGPSKGPGTNGDGDVGAEAEDEPALNIEALPYNSNYEVASEDFSVDFKTELGSGQYGVVYKGEIRRGSGTTPTTVAVKTVRPNVPKEYFKALLSELKILAYIGSHEHVAKLVGANSGNIKNRELFIGVEFCKTSLLQYLRDHSKSFVTMPQPETTTTNGNGYQNWDSPTLSHLDLVRWSTQIASGMEFLSKKRIVHGDLAARNVLLSFDLQVKICDFGLARQLVDYSYIKSTRCDLPWKWMAFESLSQMHFSTKSDVWAYGVTCWELYSLGNVPYPCITWNFDFVDQLTAGFRLPRPSHSSEEVYDKLLECWDPKPENRPNFSQLKQFFQEQVHKVQSSAKMSFSAIPMEEISYTNVVTGPEERQDDKKNADSSVSQ